MYRPLQLFDLSLRAALYKRLYCTGSTQVNSPAGRAELPRKQRTFFEFEFQMWLHWNYIDSSQCPVNNSTNLILLSSNEKKLNSLSSVVYSNKISIKIQHRGSTLLKSLHSPSNIRSKLRNKIDSPWHRSGCRIGRLACARFLSCCWIVCCVSRRRKIDVSCLPTRAVANDSKHRTLLYTVLDQSTHGAIKADYYNRLGAMWNSSHANSGDYFQ